MLQCPLGSPLEAAPAVMLHVSHPAHGLDLGVVGSPLVPVLVRAHLEHVLIATVARILVSHPGSSGDLDASHTVLETIRPQAGDVLVTHLHLATFKVITLIQADLVVLGVHADGSDRHHAVTPVAVGPGVPAGVLSLLQHEHLTSQVLLLVTHEGSALHSDGANPVKALLTQVTTLSSHLHPAALEVLIFVEVHLVRAHPHGRVAANAALST